MRLNCVAILVLLMELTYLPPTSSRPSGYKKISQTNSLYYAVQLYNPNHFVPLPRGVCGQGLNDSKIYLSSLSACYNSSASWCMGSVENFSLHWSICAGLDISQEQTGTLFASIVTSPDYYYIFCPLCCGGDLAPNLGGRKTVSRTKISELGYVIFGEKIYIFTAKISYDDFCLVI